ncbi:MAG TPA: VOC family protein [Acidimicrobiales bacterium]|jgi:predicted enzyme related to lactoylglutathione lyase
MINAVHTLIYADDPEAARSFFRDVLNLPVVDDGGGWLIFKLPPAELGVHPTEGGSMATDTMRLSLMCDDIEATVRELEAKGVELLSPVEDFGYGLVTTIRVPGGATLDLYEPHHATAFDLKG